MNSIYKLIQTIIFIAGICLATFTFATGVHDVFISNRAKDCISSQLTGPVERIMATDAWPHELAVSLALNATPMKSKELVQFINEQCSEYVYADHSISTKEKYPTIQFSVLNWTSTKPVKVTDALLYFCLAVAVPGFVMFVLFAIIVYLVKD